MPNTFHDKRDSHLRQAHAFLNAAQQRASDNLPFRTALADAVESIKHSLQAYLWLRVGALFPRDPAARFQEIAIKGSMPELLSAVQESGLQLGDDAKRIRDFNDLRNQYTHGLPQRGVLVTQETADDAIKIANRVDLRVQKAMGLGAATAASTIAPAPSAPSAARATGSVTPATQRTASAASAASAAVRSAPVPAAASSAAAATTATAPAAPVSEPAAESGEGDEVSDGSSDASDGADDLDSLPARVRARRRFPWIATLAAALTFVLGIAVGGTGAYALASGHAPPWLALPPILAQLAPTSTPAPTATVMTSGAQSTGPFVAGDLLITPSACGTMPATLTLRNTGALPLAWSAGSPDAPGAAFALATGAVTTTAAHPSAAGQLAPGASVTLTITGISPGATHVVVESSGGTVAVPLGAC